MISAVNCRPLNGFLLPCFTASPSLRPHFIAGVGEASKLQQNRAGLDVFDEEPLPADNPFRQLSNVLATPHLGYVSEDNYRTYFTEAVVNIEAWLAGLPVRLLNR
jgi:hypothetical protein